MISSSLMASLLFILILLLNTTTAIMASSRKTTLVLVEQHPTFPSSTISAAPSLLPADSPLPSPPPAAAALSPQNDDITPLFPSPGTGSELSPTESSLPTIPSSPSPPNPDAISAPGPLMAFSPMGSLPISSFSLHLPASQLPTSILVMWLLLAFLFV